MTRRFVARWSVRSWLLLALLLAGITVIGHASDSLRWDSARKRVDAQIDSWDLATLLQELSTRTGWQVFVEPNTQQAVSVRFKDLPVGEALKRLLGDLNFALLPRTNGPAKLFIFRTSLQEATQLVVEEPSVVKKTSKAAIPNELIVTLRAGSKETIAELAARLGAKILGKVDGLNTYRLQFPDESAAQSARADLGNDPNVAGTDLNYMVDQPTRVENLQYSSGSNFSLKPKVGNAGNQLIVGLIDTPVQPLDAKMSQFLLPAVHVSGEPSLPKDDLTHGTSMAETILQGLTYAPQEGGGSSVRVLPVDVYGNNPDTTTFDVAKGVYAAIAAGATVINLSLGGSGDSQFLAGLIHAAHQQGVLFIGAAGNQPTTDPTFPAAYPDVIAVTAGDRRGNIAPYANRGSFVDVIAPGVSVVDYNGQSYLVRGTSTATAYVSGTAAGYRASGGSPQNVEAIIREKLALPPGVLP
jgi:hypothetical protein